MAKFKYRPILVDAIQWKGTNREEIKKFTGGLALFIGNTAKLFVPSERGDQPLEVGDWIISKGEEFYTVPQEIFENVYVPADYPEVGQ